MNTLFKRHFALTAGMILFSFALLAAAFMALSYQFTVRGQKEALDEKSAYVAQFAGRMLGMGMEADSQDFTSALDEAASLIGADVLLTDVDGTVTAESGKNGLSEGCIGCQVPASVLAQLDEKGSHVMHADLGMFSDNRFLSGAQIRDLGRGGSGDKLGYVIVSVSPAAMMELWRPLTHLFILTALVVLCIAFLSSSVTARQQVKPLQEMTDVVHRFGMGEYDLRVDQRLCSRSDEMGELGTAFNAMADSIALAERKRSEFVANISHELKTPMTTIAGFADGILDGTIPPEKEREYLKTISDETRRLSRLVRRMLDMSRLQKHDVVISQTEFDMVEVAAQTLISLEGRINAKGLDVDARLPDGPVYVWGDPDAITQVTYNLLENAIKFSHPHTVIGLSITTRGNKAYIAIRDTGETIPEEELPLIFDRLHKSDRSRSLDKEGVGLGLYLVKTILNDLKETITVTSKDDVTEFTFTLTLAR